MARNKNKKKKNNNNKKLNKQKKPIFVLDNKDPAYRHIINISSSCREMRFNEFPIETQISIKESRFRRKWDKPSKEYDQDAIYKQRNIINKLEAELGEETDDPLLDFAMGLADPQLGTPVTLCPVTGNIIRSNISAEYFDKWDYKSVDMSSMDKLITERLMELNMTVDSLDIDDDYNMTSSYNMDDEVVVSADDIQRELEAQGLIVPADYDSSDYTGVYDKMVSPVHYNSEIDMYDVDDSDTDTTYGKDHVVVQNPQDDIIE